VPSWLTPFLLGVAVSVVGGLIVTIVWYRARPRLQAREEDRLEERMLSAFLEMVTEVNPHEKLTVPVHVRSAAATAGIRDPDPVLRRLVRKGHLAKTYRDDLDYYNLTPERRQRAYDLRPSRPNLWQLLSGK
jgi:hypothetical protein